MALTTLDLNAVFVKTEQWWIAYIEELPGVNTQGHTLEEARSNLEEALQEFLEINRDLSEKDLGPSAIRETIHLRAS